MLLLVECNVASLERQNTCVHLIVLVYASLCRTHQTAADAAVEGLESLAAAAAAAASESRSTRASSRLAKIPAASGSKGVADDTQQQQRQATTGAEGAAAVGIDTTEVAASTAETGASSSSYGYGHPEGDSLPPAARGPQLRRRWVVLSVPLLPGSSSFLLQRSKVLQSLELGWSPGMRFRMQLGCCPATAAAAAATLPPVPRGLGLAVLDFALQQQHLQQQQQRLAGIIRRIDGTPEGLWGGVHVDWEERRTARPGEAAAAATAAAAAAATTVSLWDLEPLKRLKRPGQDG